MRRLRDVVNQLVDIYYLKEDWHTKKMNPDEAIKYHEKLLDIGNICYYEEGGEVLGYIEFWKLNYEQLGRIVCGAPFSAYLENVNKGKVGFLANVWIKEDYRCGHVARMLKYMFYKNCRNCGYFVGESRRKMFKKRSKRDGKQ